MECFGKYSGPSRCGDCPLKDACRELDAFDKRVARSNRRYAMLKLSCEEARLRGIDKPEVPLSPEAAFRA